MIIKEYRQTKVINLKKGFDGTYGTTEDNLMKNALYLGKVTGNDPKGWWLFLYFLEIEKEREERAEALGQALGEVLGVALDIISEIILRRYSK